MITNELVKSAIKSREGISTKVSYTLRHSKISEDRVKAAFCLPLDKKIKYIRLVRDEHLVW